MRPWGAAVMVTSSVVDPIEPLEPTIWFGRFKTVLEKLEKSEQASLEPTLRHVFHLVQLTPGPLKHLLATELTEADFELLLASGMLDQAALTLLGPAIDYQIGRSGSEVSVALILGAVGPNGSSSAPSLGRALLQAYCQCMIALSSAAQDLRATTNPRPQIEQFEPHRPSSAH